MMNTDAAAITASVDDASAFMAIFERHFDAIASYLRRRLEPAIADELAAEVFTTAFSRRRSYDDSWPDALPWLYGIAVNLLRNHRRAEQREREARARHHAVSVVKEPLDHLLQISVEPATARALLELSPADREALLLFAWADLSYEQISVALALPVGTVKSRLNRARAAVRRALLRAVPSPDEEASHG
jgi:RNA polymerase sigma factor (sigma-70 family)